MAEIAANWRAFWAVARNRREFIIATVTLIAVMLIMLRMLHFVEARPGIQLHDPILAFFTAIDLNRPIYVLLYSGLIVGIIWLLPSPPRLVFGLEVYIVYAIFRTLTLWMVPLEPPIGLIPLVDPVLTFASTGVQVNKDLFFSGHTATFSILYLLLPPGRFKMIFLAGLILMASGLILQHVHYTIDVIAAPFFSYVAFKIIVRLKGSAPPGPG